MLTPATNEDEAAMSEETHERAPRGSTNEETRQRNLSLILSTVHAQGQQTRSDLTAVSGLNRSTVLALVGELVERGLVVESEPVPDGRAGRPSPVVSPSDEVLALSVNPDVEAVTFALVGLGGNVRLREATMTPPHLAPAHVARLAREFLERNLPDLPPTARLTGVGVAVPGLVDQRDHRVVMAPNLGWSNVPLAAIIEEATGLPVTSANDASLGVIAESLFGAGRDCDNLIYLNGSTSGVGGGVISDGSLVRGVNGFGTELGHILLNRHGEKCACGRVGCLETEVNVRRIWHVLGRTVAIDELDDLYAGTVSPELAAELDNQADALAAGIASLACVFAPERVVLGGHLGALLEARSDRINTEVERLAFGPLGTGISIVRNSLRARMMPIGAAELAFAPLLRDPARTALYSVGDLIG
jgi:predicted NBD/HSP70 family sugar kinase